MWMFYVVVMLLPVAFLAAAFTGALGPGLRLDGTIDHVALVVIEAEVTANPADNVTDADPSEPLPFGWCPQAQLDGNRLIWFGDNYDARASVVVLIAYSGNAPLRGHGGTQLVQPILPGDEFAVRPAFKAAPALYRVIALETVTSEPVSASPSGTDEYRATYNVSELDPWMDPRTAGNLTVTEVHSLVTGYGVPVVRQSAPMCM